jgi:hypothetical protein
VSKRKKKRKKRKKKKRRPLPPPENPDEEPVGDMIKRHASQRAGIPPEKLEELEEKPLPDTMSSVEIEEELNELLDDD